MWRGQEGRGVPRSRGIDDIMAGRCGQGDDDKKMAGERKKVSGNDREPLKRSGDGDGL